MEYDSPSPHYGRRLWIVAAAVVAIALTVATGIVIIALSPGSVAPIGTPAAVAQPPAPKTPFEQAEQTLEQQEKALLKGDEKAWLAAVDARKPKLVTQYRTMFRSLRGLGVSQFDYVPYVREGSKGKTVAMGAAVTYCFSRPTCPAYSSSDSGAGPASVEQALTFVLFRGRYVITGLGKTDEPTHLEPAPWQSGDLVFLKGSRVTVAGPRSQSANLRQVLTIAEKSAKINDKFAGYVDNPQPRYRVLLADDKTWRSWYGGIDGDWTVAYAVPLNDAGTDVVLRMSKLTDDSELLATTVQHELGHVVTLSGIGVRDFSEDQWLTEGIAEYIGWAPKHANDSWRRQSVRNAFDGGKPPKTVVSKALTADSTDEASDRFYGLGHYATDCMAQKFGEKRLFDFVRLALRDDNTYDQASRDAFGKPWKTVDKACLAWINETA